MRFLLLILLAVSSLPAQNVMDIVHAYSEPEVSQYDRTRDYTYDMSIVRRKYKRNGTLESTTSENYEVLIVNGKPVQKLTQRNGRPVSEQESLNREREMERAQVRARAQRGAIRRFEDRYDAFELEGEEEVNGRTAWVVSAKKTMYLGGAKIRAKFWIDEIDYECAKVQSDGAFNMITIDGRARAGNLNTSEKMRVADGVWLPSRAVFRSDAFMPLTVFPVSILAQSQQHRETEVTYSNYKKFRSDSRVLSFVENDGVK